MISFDSIKIWSKKAKITVYCGGLFLDSILSKTAGFSICRSNFSQGPYSNIIHTLTNGKVTNVMY